MTRYIIDENTANIVRQMVDISLKAGGSANLDGANVVLRVLKHPASADVLRKLADEMAPKEVTSDGEGDFAEPGEDENDGDDQRDSQ